MPRLLPLSRETRSLPPLTVASTLIYSLAALALLIATVWYQPGKNPRWVLGCLALVAVLFAVGTFARGRRFTTSEATALLAVYLGVVAALTWTSNLDLAAFGNGLALPLLGIYTSWLLPRRAVIVFYAGLVAWVASVTHRGDDVLTSMAFIIAAEAVVMSEVVRILVVRISRLMYTDSLTGAHNRAGLIRRADRLIDVARRRDEPISIALIDLDGLREVNNAGGHRAGDELLTRATHEWLTTFDGDVVGRLGGDEFVVVLAGLDECAAARRLAEARASASVPWTWGVAQLRPEDTLATLLDRADLRMYEGKSGRL
ncbi:GGDEF domain-containing protein [Nocardioides sp. Kera G14]|uniref:GGDEF domain-containing protein n=1 Tax=Nocardioides sp. Kera G14 TaxID=2884264 RepID=UPI001D12C987|nr:GGDEF domain-containing protein [Nocardioides sp. Kera G14]UDY23823.1 GGDEF domain-containing protein [Nocardioides sp. Kera G14]